MNKRIQNNSIRCLLLIAMMMTLPASETYAEVVMDGSLGPKGPLAGPAFNISDDLGQTVGTNLFHSFESLNIAFDESANFTGPGTIDNIISRVTGGGMSTIDGLVRSEIASANLYFVNPAGVVFGPQASLDVNGSFHVSTANFLRLGDEGIFYADISQNSVLTVDPPSAFGFIDNDPAGISIHQSVLQVPDGETLSILGGDIEIAGANIIAPGGRIDIAGVASAGEIVPNSPGEADNLEMVSFANLGTVTVSDDLVNAGGAGGGTVIIRGGQFLLDNSNVFGSATQTGNGKQGAGVDINLSGDLICNASAIGANVFGGVNSDSGGVRITADSIEMNNSSGIQSVAFSGSGGSSGDIVVTSHNNVSLDNGSIIRTGTGGTGNSGDIHVNALSLTVRNDSFLFSPVFGGSGNGGNINISAEQIELSNSAPGNLTGINTRTYFPGTGKAGDVNINTNSLKIMAGTEISSSTFYVGLGGDVSVTSDGVVSIQGNKDLMPFQTGIFVNTLNGNGQGGSLQLNAQLLEMSTNTSIQVGTFWGTGNAGNARIEAASVQLHDASYITTSGVFGNGGNAGNLEMIADNIHISGPESSPDPFGSDFTGISTTAGPFGGNGGQLKVTATESLTLTDRSEISTGSRGPGPGGSAEIKAGRLEVTNGAIINSAARGSGDAGVIRIEADQVYVSGVHPEPFVSEITNEAQLAPSAITTQTIDKGGRAGDVIITADSIEVNDGATIDARTFGPGDGGKIQFTADRVIVSGENADMREFQQNQGGSSLAARSSVITSVESILIGDDATGIAGDIFIEATEINLSDKGLIDSTTTAPGTGGNITLLTNSMTISGDARVTAVSSTSTNAGKAGSISISAQDRVEINNGIVSTAARTAAGGDVSIEANTISLSNGAFVSARNLETGTGGSVSMTAGEIIQNDNSTITVTAEQGEGGSMNLSAPGISLTNQAEVSARTAGEGDAGTLDITASNIFWMDQSSVNSEAKQADGGNIKITSTGRINLWDSQITASVGGGPATVGGNITIDHPEFVTLSKSDIIANAFEGKGGNIFITTDIFLADDSRVDASSELGIDGEIVIDAYVTDISGTIAVLPDDFLDISLMLGDSCFARTKSNTSSLVVSSPGSLPMGPNDSLPTSVRDLFWGEKAEND